MIFPNKRNDVGGIDKEERYMAVSSGGLHPAGDGRSFKEIHMREVYVTAIYVTMQQGMEKKAHKEKLETEEAIRRKLIHI